MSSLAITRYAPAAAASGVVFVCSPGGGSSRSTFDLHIPGHMGYSMVEALTARGHAVVTADLLARAHGTADAAAALADLATESRSMGSIVVGLGHSLGAGVTLRAQADHGVFDAVALFGYSPAWRSLPPAPGRPESTRDSALRDWTLERLLASDGALWSDLDVRFPPQPGFAFGADVPTDVRVAFEADAPPVPRGLAVDHGIWEPALRAADRVTTPVLLVFGQPDAAADPNLEHRHYGASSSVTTVVDARSAHCHQVSSARADLWVALAEWAENLPLAERSPVSTDQPQEQDPS